MADTTEKKFLDQNGLARLVANMELAYSASGHTHDDRYYTETEIDSKVAALNSAINGKANSSHGNHVPTTETANNARFLRNDNTWQTVTPANIGAATSGHEHASNKITAMTGYSKPTSTSAIATTDSLNAAIGKLEKALDGKQASGSYASSSHTHDDRYYTETEIDTKLNAKVPTSRTVNGKALSANISLTASDVGASATGHTHDDRYYTESEIDSKLSGKAASSHTHAAGDITSVNASAIQGTIAAANLPSYVDDVIEGYYSSSKFYKTKGSDGTYSSEIAGETGKIYVDLNSNKTYRWSGSAYVVISETLALGETSSTAYRGDRGATAYTHATSDTGKALSSGLYKITTSSRGHVTAGTAVAKSDITALGIPAQDTTYSAATTSAAGLMSAADKTKLDGIATGANNYSLPLATSSTRGGVKIGYTQSGKNYPVQLSNEQMYVNVPWTDTTYSAATTSAAGLMSAADKTKLNGIAANANNYTLPAAGTSLGGVKSGGDVTISSGVISIASITDAEIDAMFATA